MREGTCVQVLVRESKVRGVGVTPSMLGGETTRLATIGAACGGRRTISFSLLPILWQRRLMCVY